MVRKVFSPADPTSRARSKLQSSLVYSITLLEKPQIAFLFALITYFLLSTLGGNPFRVRNASYFNFLADAFLHGQLYLRLIPKTTHDLSLFQGHFYLYWPPMPAIILMPLVELLGVGVSDVFLGVVLGALNVAVVASLLRSADRAGLIRIDPERRALLVLFFALGTVQVIMALFGKVWFTAQLLGFLFVGLAYLAAMNLKGIGSFIFTGLMIACATFTRNHLLFTGLWPAYHLIVKNWQDRPRLYLYIAAGLMPLLILGFLFLTYNYTRFGNPLELGIRYHEMDQSFLADYKKYGAFNVHYLPINFYYQYIFYPLPLRRNTWMGGSVFLLSPVFFYAFKGIFRGYRNPDAWLWVGSILATSIPILLLMGTGWVQYGPRYTFDFTVPLLLLTASGVQWGSRRTLILLIVLSILQYIPGIYLFVEHHI
jgi:hypothetical protein